jgi:arylsulfatase A-like enzyme
MTAALAPAPVSSREGQDLQLSSGFPGYTAFVPEDSAPFPKVLQGNGYSTAAFGKWHLTVVAGGIPADVARYHLPGMNRCAGAPA